MEVTRIGEARRYEAPKHFGMAGLRLQGFEATGAQTFWIGLSHFLPGGGAERDASPTEKVYVVIAGEITVVTDDGPVTLGLLDSCRVAPGEARSVENRTSQPASILVVAPYPPQEQRS